MEKPIYARDSDGNILTVEIDGEDVLVAEKYVEDCLKVNILGTEYTIETHKVSEDDYLKDNQLSGYCGEEDKLIVIADMSEKEYFTEMDEKAQLSYRNKTLRHEITHAFFNESGLSDSANHFSGPWAKNEEMVDWFAIQSPKIFKVFQELRIL